MHWHCLVWRERALRGVSAGHLKLLRGLKLLFLLLPLSILLLMGQQLHLRMAGRQAYYRASPARMAVTTRIRTRVAPALKQLQTYPLLHEDIRVQVLLRLVEDYLGLCLLIILFGSMKCHCKHAFHLSDCPSFLDTMFLPSLSPESGPGSYPCFFLGPFSGPFSCPFFHFPFSRDIFALYLVISLGGLHPSFPSRGLFLSCSVFEKRS